MKIKIKKILAEKDIPKKDGSGNFHKIQFLTEDDEVLDTFGSIEVGQEYEGEVTENQYGKTFKKAGSGGGFKGGFKSDPDTMLISYAKDIVVAFINAGVIKGEENASKQLRSFATLMFALYKQHKDGKSILPKVEPKKVENKPAEVSNLEEDRSDNEDPTDPNSDPSNDDIDVDKIPF